MEKRLLLAAEWIGQSYEESSIPGAFLKAAISLEILFTHKEKSLVNPSILSQISESVGLILGGTPEGGLKLEKQMKDLYSTRSAIVHTGKSDVSSSDYFQMVFLARAVVIVMLEDPSA